MCGGEKKAGLRFLHADPIFDIPKGAFLFRDDFPFARSLPTPYAATAPTELHEYVSSACQTCQPKKGEMDGEGGGKMRGTQVELSEWT